MQLVGSFKRFVFYFLILPARRWARAEAWVAARAPWEQAERRKEALAERIENTAPTPPYSDQLAQETVSFFCARAIARSSEVKPLLDDLFEMRHLFSLELRKARLAVQDRG
ncbi:MAG TPA: hypothetical protein VJN93_06550 [Candidatus Acidoferrum sp.]|nr:hypothetical protein [Candidatus Acidoferrum sp.]